MPLPPPDEATPPPYLAEPPRFAALTPPLLAMFALRHALATPPELRYHDNIITTLRHVYYCHYDIY